MDIQQLVNAVATALTEAFNMAWEVFWPLILGFALRRGPGSGLA